MTSPHLRLQPGHDLRHARRGRGCGRGLGGFGGRGLLPEGEEDPADGLTQGYPARALDSGYCPCQLLYEEDLNKYFLSFRPVNSLNLTFVI